MRLRTAISRAIALVLACSGHAYATGLATGYNHVGQYTATSNGNWLEYYGWRGANGYIYWDTAGVFNQYPAGADVMVASWLGAYAGGDNWVFAGITGDTDHASRYLFVENLLNGVRRHFTNYGGLAIPGAMYVKIESTGYYNPTLGAYKWDVLFGNWMHSEFNYIPTRRPA